MHMQRICDFQLRMVPGHYSLRNAIHMTDTLDNSRGRTVLHPADGVRR